MSLFCSEVGAAPVVSWKLLNNTKLLQTPKCLMFNQTKELPLIGKTICKYKSFSNQSLLSNISLSLAAKISIYNELAPLVHALIIATAIASLFIFIVNHINPEKWLKAYISFVLRQGTSTCCDIFLICGKNSFMFFMILRQNIHQSTRQG